jgi:hypothetical protein
MVVSQLNFKQPELPSSQALLPQELNVEYSVLRENLYLQKLRST